MLLHLHILPIILEPAFFDSEEAWETEAFLQTRARQRAWGGGRVYPRKVPQCSAPFQLETFPQCPCLVLRRAACPEGGLLSPSAIFLRVSSAARQAASEQQRWAGPETWASREFLDSEQELPQSLQPGVLQGAGLVVPRPK